MAACLGCFWGFSGLTCLAPAVCANCPAQYAATSSSPPAVSTSRFQAVASRATPRPLTAPYARQWAWVSWAVAGWFGVVETLSVRDAAGDASALARYEGLQDRDDGCQCLM